MARTPAGTAREGVAYERTLRRLTEGGTAGNERLTAITGAILFVGLAVLGLSIIRIGQLLWLHLFLGMALVAPVALKMASTGYRFARYYTGSPAYRRKGPPAIELRLLAPLVVLSTLVVFVTGILLLVLGPSSRQTLLPVHKISFIVWLAVTSLHVLGHLDDTARALSIGGPRAAREPRPPGRAGRTLALACALGGGAILAAAVIPLFAPWLDHPRGFHRFERPADVRIAPPAHPGAA